MDPEGRAGSAAPSTWTMPLRKSAALGPKGERARPPRPADRWGGPRQDRSSTARPTAGAALWCGRVFRGPRGRVRMIDPLRPPAADPASGSGRGPGQVAGGSPEGSHCGAPRYLVPKRVLAVIERRRRSCRDQEARRASGVVGGIPEARTSPSEPRRQGPATAPFARADGGSRYRGREIRPVTVPRSHRQAVAAAGTAVGEAGPFPPSRRVEPAVWSMVRQWTALNSGATASRRRSRREQGIWPAPKVSASPCGYPAHANWRAAAVSCRIDAARRRVGCRVRFSEYRGDA